MTDFDMNSFQNVFSACVDKVKVKDGAGRAKYLQLLESGGKSAAEGRLQLEPASAVWTSLFLCCNLANTQCLMFCMLTPNLINVAKREQLSCVISSRH